ncbi:DUF6461 domain-containing protein [Streptomyces sp. NPDC059819]|uniref:DUF6461 domain-containing protein n=1 Tax=Streptomyces sp. NPDC059819 TaxID=3346963 RepID=UPI00365101E8
METTADGLRWLPTSFRQGFSVTFARGVQPGELLRRLGCAACLTSMTRSDAESYEVGAAREGAVLRAGISGGWAYALQMWGAVGIEESAMTAASAGTECVVLISTSTIPWFAYMVDGEEICAFDPGLPDIRYGTGSGEMVAAMADAGFAVDGKPAAGSAVEAMLRLAEQQFGLGLPQHEVNHAALVAGIVND